MRTMTTLPPPIRSLALIIALTAGGTCAEGDPPKLDAQGKADAIDRAERELADREGMWKQVTKADQVRVTRLGAILGRFDEGSVVTLAPELAKRPAIYLENTLYALAPGEPVTLDDQQRRTFLEAIAKMHREDRGIHTNCLFDPGVAFTFYSKRAATDIGAKEQPYQEFGTMLVCFKCGETSMVACYNHAMTLLGGAYAPLLGIAKAAFPKDAELQAVQPPGR
jgi:hypothetical protein